MLKNLASLGAAGAVQSGASRLILDMRQRTMSCPKNFIQSFSNAPFIPPNASKEKNNVYGIDNRRHCMGPSVDLFEPEGHIRRLRFTGKCPRLTTDKNISNPSIGQCTHSEVRPSRPASCPQKLSSYVTPLKLPSGNAEKLYSKETLVNSLLKSKLAYGYTNTATSERPTNEAHKTYSIGMTWRPVSKSAERGGLNRYSSQNISKAKRPLSSVPRMTNKDHSSTHLQKRSSKISQENKEKQEGKSLNRYFGSQKRISVFNRNATENTGISKKASFVDKGQVSISNTKNIRNVDSRNLITPVSSKPEIRTSVSGICSMSRLQKSNTHSSSPWPATNPSNFDKRNRKTKSSLSLTDTSSRLWSDKGNEKSLIRKFSHPFETESSPNVLENKPNTRNTPQNKMDTKPEKSDIITLLKPLPSFKSWRGNTKTTPLSHPNQKQAPNNSNSAKNSAATNLDREVKGRPNTSPRIRDIFSRTDTHKLHPGTVDANKQIAMIYKDKFDPGVLDRFRYRKVIANKYTRPNYNKNMLPQSSSISQPASSFGRNAPLARRQSFVSSAVVKALEVRNNLNFAKKTPTLPGGRRETFVVRPVSTTRHAQSASGWVPFIRPPLMSAKSKNDKSAQNSDSKENIEKLATPTRRPLRQWKEKAEKWTDSASRRPEREAKGKVEKLAFSPPKRKDVEKYEPSSDAFKTDNRVGSSTGGGKDGRRKIPLMDKRSSLKNVGTRKFQVSLKPSRHRPGYYRW